ncbi:hypothetical protein BJY16_000993 [Actinoplanes octamycinicus]|uniref:Uncharacterized protein n=1 Tax=Actinoplanes octamycinicus TaxID=135948 RepID=A0A7W7GSL0_9ACTN|nr:hypothetical protein [Actinoplanes octamycinicus]MBB4737534.1 hypothetical protein [Actinoplanes octamycinicus]GIE57839.1 hypothetical protein Aoc01nite_32410 [Actinoplanes octamycinicus]
MTTQEHHHPQTADQRIPDTEIIAVATPAPVFVDSTGRRSRLLRRIALAFGILVVSYGGLLGVSLAGGPVNSSAVLPLPGLDDGDEKTVAPPQPGPAPEATTPSSAPARHPLIESVNQPRRAPVRQPTTTAPKPAASSKPAKTTTKATTAPTKPAPAATTPKPSVSTTKPTESTTTTPAPGPTGTTVAPKPPTQQPPAPKPPAEEPKSGPTALPTLAPATGDDPADNDTPTAAPSASGEPA